MAVGNSLTIEIALDTKSFDKQIEAVTDELELIDEMVKHPKDFNLNVSDIKELEKRAEKLNNKLVDLNRQKEKWNQEELKTPIVDLSGISNATEGIIKKVIRWGLAIFSVRSAYMFIRQSMSVLSQSNEQIASDIEYMRWALASKLQPIIEFIIKLAYTLLQLINTIAYSLFGVNLFADQTADAFRKSKDNLKGANKQAKELQKTLTGFDEMNILQDNGSVATGGGGGGIALPSTDLSKMLEGFDLDSIFNGIANWWKDIIKFWEHDILDFFDSFTGNWDMFMSGIGLLLQGVYFHWKGVFESIIGAFKIFIGIILGDTDLIKEGFDNLISGLFNIVRGFFETVLGLLTLNIGTMKGVLLTVFDFAVGILGEIKDGIGNVIKTIGDLIFKEEDERLSLERQKASTEALKEARDKLSKAYDDYADAVNNAESKEKALKDIEEKTQLSGKDLYDQVLKNYKVYKDFSPEQRKVYQAYVDNINAQKRLEEITNEMNEQKNIELANIGAINRILFLQGEAYDENFEALVKGLETGETSWEDFTHMISTLMAGLTYEEKVAFTQTLPDAVREGAKKVYESMNNPLSKFFTQTSASAKNLLSWFDKIKNSMNSISGKKVTFSVGGVSSGNAKGGIVTKLATGGIVNRPGRGIPVASSYMGEAGREGILPLTDTQAMETLGQAIGRYISINATVPVYMGNRMVAREIKKIEAESDFSYNR